MPASWRQAHAPSGTARYPLPVELPARAGGRVAPIPGQAIAHGDGDGGASPGTIDGRDGRRQIFRRFNSCEKSLSLTVFCTSTP
jgi:hypothetical protein